MKFVVVDDHALIRDAMCSVLVSLRVDAQVLQVVWVSMGSVSEADLDHG